MCRVDHMDRAWDKIKEFLDSKVDCATLCEVEWLWLRSERNIYRATFSTFCLADGDKGWSAEFEIIGKEVSMLGTPALLSHEPRGA